MALIIDLNTDELQNVVQVARQANNALTDAAALLNSIVVHTDWQCTTRDQINQNTLRNRSESLRLQADAENLYNNILYALEQFLAAEQAINASFDDVDNPIAGFLSRTPAHASDAGGKGNIMDSAVDLLRKANGGVKKALDVVSFGDIAEGLQGK